MSISASQTVDKTENAKNNEIKILVLTPESLKSHKFFFLRQPRSQIIAKMRNPCRFRYFYRRTNALISCGKSNNVKIQMWSRNLDTRILRNKGFMEIP